LFAQILADACPILALLWWVVEWGVYSASRQSSTTPLGVAFFATVLTSPNLQGQQSPAIWTPRALRAARAISLAAVLDVFR
jgi:hypothetical protein